MLKLFVTIVLPIIILLTLSGDDRLGAIPALLLSLLFPLVYGAWELARSRRLDVTALIGVISVVLTGVIGIFELPPRWMAIKEAAVPLLFAALIVASDRTRFPLVRLLFDRVLLRDTVLQALDTRNAGAAYRRLESRTAWLWAGTMAASGVIRYALTIAIVTSDPGTTAFNEEWALVTALRIPFVTLPVLVLMIATVTYLVRGTARLTDLPMRRIFRWSERLSPFLGRG